MWTDSFAPYTFRWIFFPSYKIIISDEPRVQCRLFVQKKYLVHIPNFGFFLVYSPIFKNRTSLYKTLIDVLLILLDSLERLVSFLQMSKFLGSEYLSYDVLIVTYSICSDFKTLNFCWVLYSWHRVKLSYLSAGQDQEPQTKRIAMTITTSRVEVRLHHLWLHPSFAHFPPWDDCRVSDCWSYN